MESICNYCGVLDELRSNVFFSHYVCSTCITEWYEAGRELDSDQLKLLSLNARRAKLDKS